MQHSWVLDTIIIRLWVKVKRVCGFLNSCCFYVAHLFLLMMGLYMWLLKPYERIIKSALNWNPNWVI